MHPIEKFKPENYQVIDEGTELFHKFEPEDCNALWAAYASGSPLLLKGEPGTGKSQIARAIAHKLGWGFVKEVIHGGTELSDLHYDFDAVARLAEAQVYGASRGQPKKDEPKKDEGNNSDPLDPKRFISPGAFWWAFDWTTANAQYEKAASRRSDPPEWNKKGAPPGEEAPPGVVVLLDEIDKADPDLPNGLLETLGDYQFTVPFWQNDAAENGNGRGRSTVTAERSKVLVVVTSNGERDLPAAFVRRCLVHTLTMPDSRKPVESLSALGLVEQRYAWLIERGEMHFGDKIFPENYLSAAKMLWADREASAVYRPGLAEYIDLLKTLSHVNDQDEQGRCMEQVASYFLKKDS